MNKSFQISVTPGKHQCMQSSCFFPPAVAGWASALNSLMWVMSKTWNVDPLRALNRCWLTRRDSTFVPLFFREKSSSTWKRKEEAFTFVYCCRTKVKQLKSNARFGTDYASQHSNIKLPSSQQTIKSKLIVRMWLTFSGDKGCSRGQEPPWSQSPPSKCLGDCVRKSLIPPGRILLSTKRIYSENIGHEKLKMPILIK